MKALIEDWLKEQEINRSLQVLFVAMVDGIRLWIFLSWREAVG
jgi:hypothetical protein